MTSHLMSCFDICNRTFALALDGAWILYLIFRKDRKESWEQFVCEPNVSIRKKAGRMS